MIPRALALLALLSTLPALAGCLDPLADDAVGPAAAADPGLHVANAAVPAGEAHRWESTLQGLRQPRGQGAGAYTCWLAGQCEVRDPPCDEGVCDRIPFRLDSTADVTLSLRWPTHPRLDFAARIEDASGAVLARDEHSYPMPLAAVARLERAAPGDYVAVIVARGDPSSYEGALRASAPVGAETGGEARPLLPNLVTLPPTDLSLETPDYVGVSYFAVVVPPVRPVMEAAGTSGCRSDEVLEGGARRCLRFSNAVANLGEGPLDVRLPPSEAATSGLEGRFVQRIHHADGTSTEVDAGRAEWHATHAHWHNAANDLFTLHAYDPETGERGEALREGRKVGICWADIGVADVGLPMVQPAQFDGAACLEPGAESGYSMGLTPGWYDLYASLLSDQYVEVTGVEDGTYALCSTTNQEGILVETDVSDNEACTPFRLTGDSVEPLEPEPYHAQRSSA